MIVKKNELIIVDEAKIANGFFDRLIGLMFKKEMKGFNALLIEPCNSIHTFFMRYDIDVVFLSKNNEVIKIIRNMKPWRMSWMYFRATKVLELKGGALPKEVEKGDKLVIHV